jgi:hypothetical protein
MTIEADGLLETQLPDLEIVQADGIRQYADQPELDRSVGSAGLTVQRTERFAVIAQRAGSVELPAVELPWWNVDARQWEVARIESRTVEVLPSTEAVAPVADEVAEIPIQTETVVEQSALAWWLAAVLGLGWLATAAAWWYTARYRPRKARGTDNRSTSSARGALSRVERACRVSDPQAARDALLDWASHEAVFADCTSLGALAERLPEDAADAIRDLEKHLYAAAAGDWDGARLAASLAMLRRTKERSARIASDPLPSLYS